MVSMTNAEFVHKIKSEYIAGIRYGDEYLSIKTGTINNTGFFGSLNVVFLNAPTIHHEAPGCIIAPLVNMVAKDAINIGVTGKGDKSAFARLYALEALTITTKHLSIGAVYLNLSASCAITCKKLTFCLPKEEGAKKVIEPEHIEIVKSWVISDSTEIETVKTL